MSSGDGHARFLEHRVFHAWPVHAYRRIGQMLPRGFQLAAQRTTTFLRHHTVDFLTPFSHFVIALEITALLFLSPVLNSRATRRAWEIGCSSVPLFVTTHLMLIIFPSLFPSVDSLLTTRYTFILLSPFVSLPSPSSGSCESQGTRHQGNRTTYHSHCTCASPRCLKKLPKRSELESSLTKLDRMAQQGLTSRLRLEWVFHLTSPVLVLHGFA